MPVTGISCPALSAGAAARHARNRRRSLTFKTNSQSPMDATTIIGYAAALFTTGAYLPQVTRVWRTRSTHDLSFKMLLVLAIGLVLWLLFGILKGEWPIVAANGVTLGLCGIIIFFKLRHG